MLKQQFTAVGNIGRDAEMRYTPEGKPVGSVSVGVNDGYMGQDGKWVDRTLWIRLTLWGDAVERFVQKAKKGCPIVFRAKLTYDKNGGPKLYEHEGVTRANFEMKIDEYQIFAKGASAAGAPVDEGKGEDVPAGNTDDEIPF